jgi:MoaA/NifB/PqqE/SkfB family radical SAM enzyme
MEVAAPEVLLVHPPVSIARDFIDYPYFTDLGAVQLAGVLRAPRGDATAWRVRLVDAYALPGSGLHPRDDGRLLLGAPVDEVLARCAPSPAGPWPRAVVVAYTPFHRPPARDDVLGALLAGLRTALGDGTPIVLADAYQSGQHYVEAPAEAVLAAYPEVDAWVKYEAEETVPALLEAWLRRGERPSGVSRGVSPRDLDALPLPAWDLVDLDAHDAFRARVVRDLGRGRWAFPIDGRTLPLVTSRGCPFTCVHCSSNPGRAPGEPKTQRRYSEARLRAYVEALVRRFGATRLEILERHFDALLDALDRLGVKFDVPNGMRADYLEPRHLGLMRGRVETVSVSAESGVQRVVDEVVRKRLDLAAIDAAAKNAHAAGVPLMIHWIIGLPGETGEEINGTLERALDLYERYGALPAVQYATPLPGTELARGRSLPIVDDWGPAFQKAPSQPGMAVTPDELRRFKWTFDQRLRAARGPEKVVMNVTYVCNNHCTFCAVGTRTQVDGHPTRQREHLMKYRRAGVRMVDFDGGEPTLNPELIPLVRYARAIGYERINVTTNGRLCAYEDYARKLVGSGLTTLLFSVHGHDAQTHAQQVGVAEAFDQTVAGIRHCLAHAPEGVELGMNITLTKSNHRKLDAVAQLAWDLGLRWLNVQFLTPFGRATKWVAPDTAEAARITMQVIDAWRDRIRFQVINLPFCFMPGYERYLAGDIAKLSRHMIFVNNEDVNLAAYLAERRVQREPCGPCPHRVFCGGFYELEDAPEPPWIVRAEDLVRPVSRSFGSRPAGS